MSDERNYEVEGMTCAHCRAAVIDEVGALAGVSAVDVDLGTGRVAVRGEGLDDSAIAAAIAEAGYALRE
jgi:copper chaperone